MNELQYCLPITSVGDIVPSEILEAFHPRQYLKFDKMQKIDLEINIDDLDLVKKLVVRESVFVPKIREAYGKVKSILNTRIPVVFPNYTLHDINHSCRIIRYMGKLIDNVDDLTDLEITLLILSALLHDVGMAVSKNDLDAIKSDSFDFCEMKFSAVKKLNNGDEQLALQEYVRRIHSSLSAKYIQEELKELLVIPDMPSLDYVNVLCNICESHTEDYDWIRKKLNSYDVKGSYDFNAQFVACILRLADILDIDSMRTPYNLYKLISPEGLSKEEWQQHYLITNVEKIKLNPVSKQKQIVFHGTSTSPRIHRKLLEYIGWVQNELNSSMNLLNGMQEKYNLFYDQSVATYIQTEGYTFTDYKMTLQFEAISSLLMGEKIYGDKALGLRELVQNSMDACRTRQEIEAKNSKLGDEKYIPRIKVILNKEKNIAVIKDNGTGMSQDIIKKHFLNIGVSYYNSRDFKLHDFKYQPIGNFGIGFLACFMLSSEVTVITRHYQNKSKYRIELEKGNEYTSLTEEEDLTFEGTEVILNYTEFISRFGNSPAKVKEFLEDYFLANDIDFRMYVDDSTKSQKIKKPSRVKQNEDSNLLKIEFGKYLNEIEGYALVKPKSSFIKQFREIDFGSSEVYLYSDDEGLVLFDESFDPPIDDFISQRYVSYYLIPIVEKSLEDKYLSGMKFTEDVSEVIRKFDKDLRWIAVLFKKDQQQYLSNSEAEEGQTFFANLQFSDLVEIGHMSSCKTEAMVRKVSLFEGIVNDLYLPFKEKEKDDEYSRWFYSPTKQKELYIRSVLLKDFFFNLPVVASLFDVITIEANIVSRSVIPDISRNRLEPGATSHINYALGKAIHLGVRDMVAFNKTEGNTLDQFILTYYEKPSGFELNSENSQDKEKAKSSSRKKRKMVISNTDSDNSLSDPLKGIIL